MPQPGEQKCKERRRQKDGPPFAQGNTKVIGGKGSEQRPASEDEEEENGKRKTENRLWDARGR